MTNLFSECSGMIMRGLVVIERYNRGGDTGRVAARVV